MTTIADSLRSLAQRIRALEEEFDGFEKAMIKSEADRTAYRELEQAAKSLAEAFGYEVEFRELFFDCDELTMEEEELDHARSLLMRRDIPEALIHIERAAPQYLDGLPEAVARHYEKKP